MKIEMTSLRPNIATFFKNFFLMIVTMFALKAAIQFFISPHTFGLNSLSWSPTLILMAVGTSAGVTLGARKFQLNIVNSDNLEKTKEWTIEYFIKNGLRVRENNNSGTTLESISSFNRLLNNWFGTELVSVKQTDNTLIIKGPFRHVDSVDSKLRFGNALKLMPK